MTSPNDVLNIAAREVGTKESPANSNRVKYSQWYGLIGAWCAMYCSWCLAQAGMPLNISTPRGFAYCPSGEAWFRRQGRWSGTPQIGALAFFQWPGSDRADHVGFVTGIGPGYIDTIEGNTDSSGSPTGGQVMRRRRAMSYVRGFGIPPYGGSSAPAPAPAASSLVAADQPWRTKVMAKPVLSQGASGHDVRIMQALLSVHAADLCGDRNKFIDGSFGPGTKRVLQTWQGRTGQLAADGECGPATWAWLVGV